LLNDYWVTEEIKEEIKRLLEANEHEITIYQNLWNTAKAVLREKVIAMSAYIKRIDRSQINNLMLHLKLQKNNNKQKKQKERNNKNKS
jgi:hypothetical protein